MDHPKQNVSVCIFNDKYIYSVGGYNSQKNFDDINKYNIRGDKWKSIQL